MQHVYIKDSFSDKTAFWRKIKKITSVNSKNPPISCKVWENYFKTLLNGDIEIDSVFKKFLNDYMNTHDLDYVDCVPCTEEPVGPELNI